MHDNHQELELTPTADSGEHVVPTWVSSARPKIPKRPRSMLVTGSLAF